MDDIKDKYNTSIELALELIGGKWKMIILWHLSKGTKRFNELRKLLPNITQKMLTQQLRELEKDKLITRKVYAEVPPRVEYSSTKLGDDLQNILIDISKWSNEYAEIHNIEIENY
ncbi:winged helix-turn-helix transcriptional regulator [Clostridium cellulovorans]|uniref:Transcriptional regulator, HxlR family n=1 Tax=Clostridium cellulovorans (strain ATCC 35296 / DSM 3052 / OCM 3 / 743B) TaxID=573061 RepID=D9SPD8_CLOC7|nr:helix-turn-helix domain-containing protein [Clostridium cellulovorans]ADL54040.1 transcriptional regulator, HxlR family [Clostridium cellulovorans 743B]